MLDPTYIWCLLLVASINQITSEEIQPQFLQYDTLLMSKFDKLEAKVLHQEIEITSLKEQVQRLESILLVENANKNSRNVADIPKATATAIFTPRTCTEARDSGLPEFQASDMYWIDPDGIGIGDGPIRVYCNMTTGTTSVGHDSESTMGITKCNTAGCYSRSIAYENVTVQQMKSLADISSECQQSIQVNCFGGPFTFNDTDYAWWNDIDGNNQTFWTGSDVKNHTCQCGTDKSCVRPDLKCNCDANVAIPLSDSGVIKLKNVLPITKLNFGRINHNGGSHTLGKFECSGKTSTVDRYPKSCQDLWRIGHTLDGFFIVQANNHAELVYCEFGLGRNVKQTRVGYVDVKSEPVQFYVQRSKSFSEVGVPIPFDIEKLNEGSAINMRTGIFTAPKPGTYLFDFSGVSDRGASFNVDIFINDKQVGSTLAESSVQSTVTLPSIFKLVKGNQVKLSISKPAGTLFSSANSPYTHFIGILLEEDIFQ